MKQFTAVTYNNVRFVTILAETLDEAVKKIEKILSFNRTRTGFFHAWIQGGKQIVERTPCVVYEMKQ